MIAQKICLLGSFAVGKSSLVARFVEDKFSDVYQTTIGVNIKQRLVEVDGRSVNLQLWDLPGDDHYQRLRDNARYLLGSHGFILVADGTRAATLTQLEQILTLLVELGKEWDEDLIELPAFLLLNKSDLEESWEIESRHLAPFGDRPVVRTSAKTGAGVAEGFQALTRRLLQELD